MPQYRALVEHAPVAIAVSRNGKTVWANDRYATLFGFERPSEATGKPVGEVWALEDREEVERMHARGEAASWNGRGLRRSGTTFPVHVEIDSIALPDGPASVAFHFDRTTQARMEDALVASEARFRSYFASPLVGIAITSPSHAFVEVNDRICEILGYSREELVRMQWSALTHPDDVTKDVVQFDRVMRGEIEGYTLDKRFIRKNGEVIWTLISVRAVRHADGTLDYVCGTLHDVTDRLESEERFRQIAEHIDEVFWIVDSENDDVLYVSPAYETVWGRSCASLYASPRTWLDAIHPDDRARVTASEAEKARGRYDETYRIVRPDGAIRWIHDRAVQLKDSSGKVRRVIGTATDITAQRTAESQLRHAQKMEAIGVLAGGVAHDFNNILSVILGYAAALLEDAVHGAPIETDSIVQIQKAGERAANLTRQLLAFSRKQHLEPRLADLGAIISGMDKMLRRMIGEDVRLASVDEPWPLWVFVDIGQIEQVLMNLVVNARDAMPGGGTLTIDMQASALDADEAAAAGTAPGRYAVITVTDTGHGMDKATQARVFEPFFTTKGVGKGTGLGLSTVFGIVRQSGGHVSVESEPGKGTTFRVWLPLATSAVARDAAPIASPHAPLTPRETATILVVEDDEAIRRLVCKTLGRSGYHVLEAQSGGDALLVVEQHRERIDLVLTDVVMPLMRGDELVQRLQSARHGLRALYISGYAQWGAQQPIATSSSFLHKPFTPDVLLNSVRKALSV